MEGLLAGAADGTDAWDAALGRLPAVRAGYRALEAELWAPGRLDARLAELCRLRVASLVGDRAGLDERTPAAVAAGLTEQDVAELARWPTSGRFGAAERAALEFSELFVIDAHQVTDAMCAALRSALGDAGAVALTTAVAVFDATSRARLVLCGAGGGA